MLKVTMLVKSSGKTKIKIVCRCLMKNTSNKNYYTAHIFNFSYDNKMNNVI